MEARETANTATADAQGVPFVAQVRATDSSALFTRRVSTPAPPKVFLGNSLSSNNWRQPGAGKDRCGCRCLQGAEKSMRQLSLPAGGGNGRGIDRRHLHGVRQESRDLDPGIGD